MLVLILYMSNLCDKTFLWASTFLAVTLTLKFDLIFENFYLMNASSSFDISYEYS